MVQGSSDYGQRLAIAMGVKDGTRPDAAEIRALARDIKVSYQAVAKVWKDGGTKMLSALNNSLAAARLGVDSDWLATGAGEMHSTRVWPLDGISPADFATLSEIDVHPALVILKDAIRRRRSVGTSGEFDSPMETRAQTESAA